MKVTRAAVRYRSAALFLTALIVFGGAYSYLTIPKESNPSIEIPFIVITAFYPGASPEEVADLVTDPIEREIRGAEGIEEIRSTSRQSVSSIVVEFGTDVPTDEADQRVRQRVERARATLPPGVEPPLVREINISELPIMTVNLRASYSLDRLKQVSKDLQEELETIPQVLRVDTIGGLTRQVEVRVDLMALQGHGLTFQDLVRTIESENVAFPGGTVELERQDVQVRVDGRFDDPSRIGELVVAAPGGGAPIYVKNVAEVDPRGFKDRDSFARVKVLRREVEDGVFEEVQAPQYEQAISLAVRKRSEANVLATVEEVRQVLASYDLPSGTDVLVTGNRAESVRTLVQDLQNNIVSGVLLIFLILLLFLGPRPALVVGATVPLTLLLVFAVFRVWGQDLNFIMLFSLIIALGILVDFALIIVENIQRFREEGTERWDAVRQATDEIGRPVVAGTATTVLVFVPLLFWTGTTGEFLRFIPLTLITTLLCALFVALVVAPTLAGFVLGGAADDGGEEEDGGSRSTPWPRRLGWAMVAVAALVVGLTNWTMLAVLTVFSIFGWALYRRVLAPLGAWLRETWLPGVIEGYRDILRRGLDRDYDVARPYLRNMGALVAFTAGAAMLLVGAGLAGLLGRAAGLVLLVPGALLAIAGSLGIVLHAAETAFLARRGAVKTGLIVAGLVALTLVPAVLGGGLRWPALVILPVPALLVAALGALGAAFAGGRRWLVLTDNRSRVLNTALACVFAVVGLVLLANPGTAFFPTTDPDQVRVVLEAPVGTRVEASNRLAERAVERLEALMVADSAVRANVQNVVVSVGVAESQGFGAQEPLPARSRVTLNMVDFAQRTESSMETLRKVRESMDGFLGADVAIERSEEGPPTGAPVIVEVSGPDFERVVRISEEVTARLRSAAATDRVPGLVDVTNDLQTGQPQLRVQVDRERASRFGLSTSRIGGTVAAAIQGTTAATYRVGEDVYDIMLRLRPEDRRSLQSLERLTVGRVAPGAASASGQLSGGDGSPVGQVPLVAVADLTLEAGLGAVTRLDLEPLVTVEGEAAPGFNEQAVIAQVRALLGPYQDSLPGSYQVQLAGQEQEQSESFEFLLVALVLGVGLMVMALVWKFNSLIVATIILLSVGFTFFGVALGLVVTRTAFGLLSFLGVISLAGIVVDDDIVIHEFIESYRAEGMEKGEAIVEAGASRFRQVVLTSLSTVVALVPLTFGLGVDFIGLATELEPAFRLGGENTQFWRSLGLTMITGLPFATLVSLGVAPILYSALDSTSVKVAGMLGRPPGAGALVPVEERG